MYFFFKLFIIINMLEWLCMNFCYLYLEVICIYIYIEMQGFVIINICNGDIFVMVNVIFLVQNKNWIIVFIYFIVSIENRD